MTAVRPLPTAFDPPEGQVTVATPSCCCCCCCCLSTGGAVMMATAGEAYFAAQTNDQPRRTVRWALALGLLSIPIASIGVLEVAGTSSTSDAPIAARVAMTVAAGVVTYAVMALIALRLAGVPTRRSARFVASASVLGVLGFVVEFALGFFTFALITLLCPLGFIYGWHQARRRHGYPSRRDLARRPPPPAPPADPPELPPWPMPDWPPR